MTDTVISAAPWIALIQPYITAVLTTVIIPAAIGYAAFLVRKWTGVAATQSDLALLTATAQTKAGAMIAAASDNLANRSVTLNSPAVVAAANEIAKDMPTVVKSFGLTPEKIATIVAGEVGKMQAQMVPLSANPPMTPLAQSKV